MSEPQKHLPADERRAATVKAVIALAASQNPSDITTTAIAQHMGLTQGALFRHFPTKDAILESVMTWVADQLVARIDKATQNAPSATAALEAAFLAHIQFVAEHPGMPRILFAELQRPTETPQKKIAQTLIRNYSTRLRRLLEAGKEQGAFDAALDIDAASASFIGFIQGLIIQSLLASNATHIRRDAPGVFSLYLRGIRSKS